MKDVEKEIKLRPFQQTAINAIFQAIRDGQKQIKIKMATGTGKTTVVIAVIKKLREENSQCKILVVVDGLMMKEQIVHRLFDEEMGGLFPFHKDFIDVITGFKLKKSINILTGYDFVVADNILVNQDIYENVRKRNIAFLQFLAPNQAIAKDEQLTDKNENCVFNYPLEKAVKEGVISPSNVPQLYGSAMEGFCERLLQSLGGKHEKGYLKQDARSWDLILSFEGQYVAVECKSYNSRNVSPNMLATTVSNLRRRISRANKPSIFIPLLIIFGEIPQETKDDIYHESNIVVWDIANLIYYTQKNQIFLKELSELTYFPIADISSVRSERFETLVVLNQAEGGSSNSVREESIEYIEKLKACKMGQKYYQEYEDLCKEIIETLFSDVFHRISNQHKTKDKHFRMDLICSLKAEYENIHTFWKLISRNYNSHFLVFECKNYNRKLDQNLIYTTEKYLFEAALRKVAIIISRNGFSESANFAAMGCLKENGKLILSITDEDLYKMLQAKENGDDPTDILLNKLEEFLMAISK